MFCCNCQIDGRVGIIAVIATDICYESVSRVRNGSEVSTNPFYAFDVEEGTDLVANFILQRSRRVLRLRAF